MSPKKVLLVGAGNIARSHAAALKDTPGVVLYGVFDANAATAEGLARDFIFQTSLTRWSRQQPVKRIRCMS